MSKTYQTQKSIDKVSLSRQPPLKSEAIFKEGGLIDWHTLRQYLKNEGLISEADFRKLIKIAAIIFKSEPTLVQVQDPVTIVGDIHGQFYDFLKLIQPNVGGNPDNTKYVFLGDYVDRGYFSIELLILLLALKISHPKSLFMLRGNHQCRHMTSQFNFRQECLKKYNQQIYELIMDLFDCLPLACLINKKFLCLHGGISHQIRNLDDIRRINRFKQIPTTGLFCDLMWADPIQEPLGMSDTLVIPNLQRNCSYIFGKQLTDKFLQKNSLVSVIRAHEIELQGFKMYSWGGLNKFPSVITIFSAPNYLDFYDNKGAVIKFVDNTLSVQQYNESPRPYILPNFLDLFGWSIPFVIEKVTQILHHIIQPNQKIKKEQDLPLELIDKKHLIEIILAQSKKQIQQNMFLASLNGRCPDDKLLDTGKYTSSTLDSFQSKRLIDIQNQSRPL